ncbi:MAG: hypothetical protein AAGD11_04585 [Planctomycetota bacterium]
MANTKKWKNPFYTLLIPAGAAFCLTGVAFGMMAFQQVNAGRAAIEQTAGHPLFAWLEAHGTTAMLIELSVLAVLTVGAIATDDWWMDESVEAASEHPDNGDA